MGLAPLIVVFKTLALRTGNTKYNDMARFWAKIFGINFVIGVVTGIPMEFQFGTNWSHFSRFAGGVIGQTLAMEGTFAFFLESAFLGLFLYGEKRLSQKAHWWSAFAVFVGSWISGYFIVATDAWMQHPQGYSILPDGSVTLSSFWALVLNHWALWQYAHNMAGAVVTGSFAMAAVGAYYLLSHKFEEFAKTFVRTGVIAGLIATFSLVTLTGDGQGRNIVRYQPATLAAMEALFDSRPGAPIVILGQPDVPNRKIDNPLVVPNMLSFLSYRSWSAEVKGLDAFPQSEWPDNIPLLYYSYHIMVGLGTIFAAVLLVAAFLLWRKKLFESRWMLWVLMLSFPFPYIANTAGWMTAELGRQPYLVYGLLKTVDGFSKTVSAGNGWFTLLGFMGMYTMLGSLFLLLIVRELAHGPEVEAEPAAARAAAAEVK